MCVRACVKTLASRAEDVIVPPDFCYTLEQPLYEAVAKMKKVGWGQDVAKMKKVGWSQDSQAAMYVVWRAGDHQIAVICTSLDNGSSLEHTQLICDFGSSVSREMLTFSRINEHFRFECG